MLKFPYKWYDILHEEIDWDNDPIPSFDPLKVNNQNVRSFETDNILNCEPINTNIYIESPYNSFHLTLLPE